MTRVDKINEAIRFLFVNKGQSVREIQSGLKLYGVELSLVELLTIVSSFNYKPIKERKKSKTQERRESFRPVLEPLVRVASSKFITNKRLLDYIRYKGVPYPSGGKFSTKKLENLIADYNFNYDRFTYGGHKKQISCDETLFKLIEAELLPEELENLEEWVLSNA